MSASKRCFSSRWSAQALCEKKLSVLMPKTSAFDDFPSFQSSKAEVFGISTDSFFSHKAWADHLELKHRLLADMHRTVSKSYGLYFEPLNCAKRATVIVDKNGKVAYVKVQEVKTARDDKDILAALKRLS